MTDCSTVPNISRKSRSPPKMQNSVMKSEITNTVSTTCPAARLLSFLFPLPIYREQTIAAPAAIAEKICMTRLLIESTSATADIASLPTVETIIVSAIPIREFRNCSTTIGRSSQNKVLLSNKRLFQSICFLSYRFIDTILAKVSAKRNQLLVHGLFRNFQNICSKKWRHFTHSVL